MSAAPVVLDLEYTPDECAEWAATAPLGEGVLLPFGVIDPEALSQGGRIDLLVALERVKGWVEAQQARVLASAEAHAVPPRHATSAVAEFRAKQYVREEIACALRWSAAVTGDRLGTARTLVDLLPATLAKLEVGELPVLHARSVADAVHDLARAADGAPDPGLVSEFEAHVLERAGQRTVSEFRAVVTRALHRFDPRTQAERHRAAAADRKVTCSPEPDGMAFLGALLPAADAQTVLTTIQAVADRAAADRSRTADQKRADALVELCQAALDRRLPDDLPARPGRRAAVQVSVALSTLLGLDEQPGELTGYGPIPGRGRPRDRVRPHQHLAPPAHRPPRPPARLRPHHLPAPHRPARARHRRRTHLHKTRLHPPRPQLRPRPPHRLERRRPHQPRQPRPQMPPRPQPQTRRRPAPPPPTRRHQPLDHPAQPDLRQTTPRIPDRPHPPRPERRAATVLT